MLVVKRKKFKRLDYDTRYGIRVRVKWGDQVGAWSDYLYHTTISDEDIPKPTNISLDFKREQGARNLRWSCIATWDETVLPSCTERVDEYVVQLWEWDPISNSLAESEFFKKTVVKARDQDDNDIARAKFFPVPKNKWYIARVRAIVEGVRGPWSNWSGAGSPQDKTPPPTPQDVTIIPDEKRVIVTWEVPSEFSALMGTVSASSGTDTVTGFETAFIAEVGVGALIRIQSETKSVIAVGSDTSLTVDSNWSNTYTSQPFLVDRVDDSISHAQVQASNNANFTNIVDKDMIVNAQRISFKIKNESYLYYIRVRFVDSSGVKSAWIPATLGGNSSPGASPDGVGVGASGGGTVGDILNIDLDFDVETGSRSDRFRAIVSFDEVDEATFYSVQLQKSTDGVNFTDYKNDKVSSAKDEDENTRKRVIIHNVKRKFWYRARARAISGGVRGTWCDWTPAEKPIDSSFMSAPTSVILEIDNHVLHVSWVLPKESGSNIPEYGIDHCEVEVSSSSTFSPVWKSDYFVRGERKTFRITKPGTTTYWARVRTISETEAASSWVSSSSSSMLSPSTPAAPFLNFDTAGTKNARYRALVTVNTVSGIDADIDKYIVQLATNISATTSGARRRHGMVEGDAGGDDLTEVFKNIPKNHYVWARTRAVDTQGRKSAWSSWAGGSLPSAATSVSAPTGVTVTQGTRRVRAKWNKPADTDETAAQYRVDVYANGSYRETGYTRSNHYGYDIPSYEKDLQHQMYVYARDDLGNESGAGSAYGYGDDIVAVIGPDSVGPNELAVNAITSKHAIVAPAFYTGFTIPYIILSNAGNQPDRLQFVTANGIGQIIANQGGVQFTGQLGFFGANPTGRSYVAAMQNPENGDSNARYKINEIIQVLQNYGLF